MSFFRSAHDVSESDETSSGAASQSEDYSISRVRTIGSHDPSDLDTSDAFSPSSAPAAFHTQGLIHSLLEERCMYQALTELQKRGVRGVDSIHHPEVRALGHSKYLRVSRSLGGLGVIKQGFDSQHYSPLRQNYLDGLDVLSQQTSAPTRPQMQKAVSQMDMAIPETFRKYVAASRDMQEIDRQVNLMAIAGRRSSTLDPTFDMTDHPILDDTKYSREFDEFNVLGKGGYGIVFHVKHKLDGGSYAIKKIPMGSHRIRRIQQHGQSEMDEILLELRTLARLNHPNVVRYHTGWIEYATFSSKQDTMRVKGRKLLEAPGRQGRSEKSDASAPSIDIQFEFDDDVSAPTHNNTRDQQVDFGDHSSVFEHSTSAGHSRHDRHFDTLSIHTASLRDNDNELQKTRSRNTIASVSDEEVEFVPRYEDPTSVSGIESSSLSDDKRSSLEPCLALHIQMSLYSMTLSDFLSSSDRTDVDSSEIASLRHCFHRSASLALLLSIMDGVRYLHRESIVHRDLKPGNIFLAVRPGTDCPPGAIDLSSCKTCTAAATVRPFNMDVCIGDFGLVSTIATADDQTPIISSRVVGTEIYRPENITRDNHPSLDIFALGVIAFELFWRFSTRMERHETLLNLKKGRFPEGFDEKVKCAGLQRFIASMVSASEMECPSWESLKAGAIDLMG